jgi:hypothetical protein
MGNNQASADLAKNAAAQNAMNAILGVGKLAVGAGGFGSTGGGLVGGLFGGGGSAPATGAGSPGAQASNGYALSQGINPWSG